MPLVPTGSIFHRIPHWLSCIQSCPTPTHTPEAQESQSDPLKIYIRSHRLPAPVAACVWQGGSQDDLQWPCPHLMVFLYGEWKGSNALNAISEIRLPNMATSICHQTFALSLSRLLGWCALMERAAAMVRPTSEELKMDGFGSAAREELNSHNNHVGLKQSLPSRTLR